MASFYDDKLLSRFLFMRKPAQPQDVEFAQIPSAAIVVHPHFCVSRDKLFYPAHRGIKGMVLGEFKSSEHVRHFLELLGGQKKRSVDPLVISGKDKFKFLMNQFVVGDQVLQTRKEARDGLSGHSYQGVGNAPELRYEFQMKVDLNAALEWHLRTIAGTDMTETFPFYANFVEKDIGTAYPEKITFNPYDYKVLYANLEGNNVIPPEVTTEIIETQQLIRSFQAGTKSPHEPPTLFGPREVKVIDRIYKRWFQANQINVVGASPSIDSAIGKLIKQLKINLRKMKTNKDIRLLLRVMDTMDLKVQDVRKIPTTRQDGYTIRNEGLGIGWGSTDKIRKAMWIDENERPTSSIRMKIPKDMEKFIMTRLKSMPKVLKTQDDMTAFAMSMAYVVINIYAQFFMYLAPPLTRPESQGKASHTPVPNNKLFLVSMSDYFKQIVSVRSSKFPLMTDQFNTHQKIRRVLKVIAEG